VEKEASVSAFSRMKILFMGKDKGAGKSSNYTTFARCYVEALS
jgi:hypothetical protein